MYDFSVGDEGIEWSTTIAVNLNVAYLYFAEDLHVLIALCNNPQTGVQTFYRCQIVKDALKLTLLSSENLPKKITCCEMCDHKEGNPVLLIGTFSGNIYAVWIQNFELVDYLIFEDTALKK